MTDPEDLAARLDRITFLLVGVVVLQAADLLGLGPAGLILFLVVGLFVTALYNADV
ncbi:hypothetical protein [Halorussus caseinilyticus]|uniref:Uncharacterized protein n=1 Tax=Halorussus caseinilyticus TaxID=3034025 RepID=A0ABD5WRA0_9EURY|nr:hypothetical protein [Halorussus sp. DT72]